MSAQVIGGLHPLASGKLKLQNAIVGKNKSTQLTHLNKYRTDTGLYLYTDAYSAVSTRAVRGAFASRSSRTASGRSLPLPTEIRNPTIERTCL